MYFSLYCHQHLFCLIASTALFFYFQEWEVQQSLHQKLQGEVDKLEAEKKKLLDIMQAHRPSCIIKTQDAFALPESIDIDSR